MQTDIPGREITWFPVAWLTDGQNYWKNETFHAFSNFQFFSLYRVTAAQYLQSFVQMSLMLFMKAPGRSCLTFFFVSEADTCSFHEDGRATSRPLSARGTGSHRPSLRSPRALCLKWHPAGMWWQGGYGPEEEVSGQIWKCPWSLSQGQVLATRLRPHIMADGAEHQPHAGLCSEHFICAEQFTP